MAAKSTRQSLALSSSSPPSKPICRTRALSSSIEIIGSASTTCASLSAMAAEVLSVRSISSVSVLPTVGTSASRPWGPWPCRWPRRRPRRRTFWEAMVPARTLSITDLPPSAIFFFIDACCCGVVLLALAPRSTISMRETTRSTTSKAATTGMPARSPRLMSPFSVRWKAAVQVRAVRLTLPSCSSQPSSRATSSGSGSRLSRLRM